jgi:Asp/Glu/hydantoin racemase
MGDSHGLLSQVSRRLPHPDRIQPEVAAAVDVPVFMSALVQVPLIQQMLGPGRKVGIITADTRNLTEQHVRAVGWSMKDMPVAVVGIENEPDFDRGLLTRRGYDSAIFARIEQTMVRTAQRLVQNDSAVGAIVFECTNVPPFADAVQRATNLPVFDIVTLINMVHAGLVRTRYKGHY